MQVIGFWGQVNLEELDKLVKENKITFIHAHRKPVYAGTEFVKEQLKSFDVNCEWVYGYEDGKVEFEIDIPSNEDVEKVKEAVSKIKGLVTFLNFF